MTFGAWHIIIWLSLVMLYLWPVGRILRRMGLPPALALVFVIPLVNLVGFWVLAYAQWRESERP